MLRGQTFALIFMGAAGLAVGVSPLFRRPMDAHGNHTSAVATLRNLASSQDQLRSSAQIDVDHDGAGEFGFPGELAGAVALPGRDAVLNPPVLSSVFRTVDEDGRVRRAGYYFCVLLPDADGDGVSEVGVPTPPPPPPSGTQSRCCGRGSVSQPLPPRNAPTDRVDPALASRKWCAYAWPIEYGRTGTPTFFINQDGVVLRVDDARYSGDRGPSPGAAFAAGGALSITGVAAADRIAQDGNVWNALQ